MSPLLKKCLGGAALALSLVAASPAMATDLPPGGTLDPIPIVALPAGATVEANFSEDFDITWTQFPFTRHVTGTISQTVYRLPDNTLTFRYYVSNDGDSDGAITDFGASNFSGFETDVSLISTLLCFNCSNSDRAVRDIFGTGINFEWDLGIPTGFNSRAMIIRTDATSYRVSSGRFQPLGYGRVTVRTGQYFQTLRGFAYPVVDSSPPIASISGPSALEHSCPPVTITGRAYDTSGFDSYTLEYATNANGPWTLIGEFEDPVNPDGTLGVWDANVPEGYYFIRLTALNTAELSTVVTGVVYIDRAMSPVQIRSPRDPNPAPQVLGGAVCFDGTVWDSGGSSYSIQYRALPADAFAHVNPGSPSYPGQIITDGLGSWNTRTGPTAVPDGLYQVRIAATDSCSNTAAETRDILIDNTAPIAVIASPMSCAFVRDTVTITGTVADANLAGWSLSYTGGDATGWVTIASGINCGSTTNQTSHYVSVNLGCPSDFNRDGVSNSQDFFDFLTAFFTPCL